MKNTIRNATLMASMAFLAACATATPYQEASKAGKFDGFSQTVIEKDRARVSFAGNSLTDRETVENYLLFRAAELTVESGFDHFTLIERDVEKDTQLRSTGSSFNSFNSFNDRFFLWNGVGFNRFGSSRFGGRGFNRFGGSRYGGSRFGFGSRGFDNFDVREITKYRATAEVRFGNGSKPEEADNAFDARDVINNLGPIVVYPEDSAEDQAPISQTAEFTPL